MVPQHEQLQRVQQLQQLRQLQQLQQLQQLHIKVTDNGRGVDPGFDLDASTGLGLSIVRTLVTTELNGTISIRPAVPEDLDAAGLGDGSSHSHGTVIELSVPTVDD